MTAPYVLHLGDCLDVLREMPDANVDAIVTDPPYGLGKEPDALAMLRDWVDSGHHDVLGAGFMGKKWDAFVPQPALWRECLRVLKPGGHLLSFGGSRTYDLVVLGLRIAGFEVRDCVMWVYGSGFPKSLDVSKAIDAAAGAERQIVGYDPKAAKRAPAVGTHAYGDFRGQSGDVTAPATDEARRWEGWGTALKPAHEPVVIARKPLAGTVAANVLAHGTGALNIDGCRVEPTRESRERVGEASQDRRYTDRGSSNFAATPGTRGGDPAGRWPANVIHDGSDEVRAVFPQAPGQMVKAAEGGSRRKNQNAYRAMTRESNGAEPRCDTGSAARFFYCAKASKRDRGEGNAHPTVKPTDLMRYLCRLVTPPGGVVLDPFMGSGSTGKGAMLEGFRFVGIEQDSEYFAMVVARVAEAARRPSPFVGSVLVRA